MSACPPGHRDEKRDGRGAACAGAAVRRPACKGGRPIALQAGRGNLSCGKLPMSSARADQPRAVAAWFLSACLGTWVSPCAGVHPTPRLPNPVRCGLKTGRSLRCYRPPKFMACNKTAPFPDCFPGSAATTGNRQATRKPVRSRTDWQSALRPRKLCAVRQNGQTSGQRRTLLPRSDTANFESIMRRL